tara:strand:- start:441 stop:563 length:123 start_codon:yes stop_codon:yes gene_type:complete
LTLSENGLFWFFDAALQDTPSIEVTALQKHGFLKLQNHEA